MPNSFEIGQDLMMLLPALEEYLNNDVILTKEQKSEKLATLGRFKDALVTFASGPWLAISASEEGRMLLASSVDEPKIMLALMDMASEHLKGNTAQS